MLHPYTEEIQEMMEKEHWSQEEQALCLLLCSKLLDTGVQLTIHPTLSK